MSTAQLITEFIAKWGPGGPAYGLNEEQGAQQHFLELCAVLGVGAPHGGDDYLFEKGMMALGQRRGIADVFKRNCFAWENKAPGKSLDDAMRQLMIYALALENPPLLIVCDRLRIEIHTHFNGTPSERHVITLAELADPAKRELLRRCFEAPETFRPTRTNRQITEEAAQAFATTAERLRAAGHPAEEVSHFLTQCLFCFFAEDVGLLPGRMFERLVGNRNAEPAAMRSGLQQLFITMRDGGLFGADSIPWFNGGLFLKIDVPLISADDVAALRTAAGLDWSAIDPSIIGTLFERGLDPKKRSQLGAHYTDPATIMRLVEPVVIRPLVAEWQQVKETVAKHLARHKRAGDAEHRKARAAFIGFLEKLRKFRVLDPACGSGNFLYLALKALKDIEHQANIEAETLGLQREFDAYTSPANVLGIEINEYAAELARVTVWIGELQWRLQHGYPFKVNPILDPLDQIECRDALMNVDGSEAAWPRASVVIGNPPFRGRQEDACRTGRRLYRSAARCLRGPRPGWRRSGRATGSRRPAAQIETAMACRPPGLWRPIRSAAAPTAGARSRSSTATPIFDAWSDEPWVNDGAAVRVSLIAFGHALERPPCSTCPVVRITADLSVWMWHDSMSTCATRDLPRTSGAAFHGTHEAGPSTSTATIGARDGCNCPNPNGRSQCSDVVQALVQRHRRHTRPSDTWIIDFGVDMSEVGRSNVTSARSSMSRYMSGRSASSNRNPRLRATQLVALRRARRRKCARAMRCLAALHRDRR